jgi:hypothetical protein
VVVVEKSIKTLRGLGSFLLYAANYKGVLWSVKGQFPPDLLANEITGVFLHPDCPFFVQVLLVSLKIPTGGGLLVMTAFEGPVISPVPDGC